TLAVVGALTLGKRVFQKQRGVLLGCVVGIGALVLFTFQTIQRNRDYLSELSIWQDAVKKLPGNPRAYVNLGFALVGQGRLQESIGPYEEALRIQPDYPDWHNDLGVVLMRLDRLSEAIGNYEQALRIKPDYAEAHYNLGIALMRQGRSQE